MGLTYTPYMNKIKYLWLIAWAFAAISCTVESSEATVANEPQKVFARIESVNDPESKVYTDEDLNIMWDSDDRISLFSKSTANQQFIFTGTAGSPEGEFSEAEAGSVTGAPLDYVYAVYPYKAETEAVSEGAISMELPSEQIYRSGSFGPGANAMVSATEDNNLLFKNLCGYFILKLYGDNVSVKSVTLEGKNHEPLAGSVDVTAPAGQIPSLNFKQGASTSVTLNCTAPVTIGNTAESATVFWLAVPPTNFTKGFKVTITDSAGNKVEKSASSAAEILRNTTYRMKALKVNTEPVYQVTNDYVQKYMEEVHYADMDFAAGSVLRGSNFPGGVLYNNSNSSLTTNADIPPSVTINWTKSSSTLIVDLYDNGTLDRSYTINGGSSMALANLVPGRHYTYKVYRKSDNEVKGEGGFYTKGALHQVFYNSKVRNGRDIGGWKTLDGQTVSYKKLYRGGEMDYSDYLSSDGRAEMLAEGIKAEIDLREKSVVGKIKESALGSGYSFCKPGFPRGYYFPEWEEDMIEDNAAGIKECFEFTVNCLRNSKPVYFHCSAGRDRTGTLAILYLGVLGVREGDIAKDYELTYFSPADWSLQKGGDGNYFYNHTREVETYRSTVEYLASLAPAADRSFKAGVEQYLLNIGVSQADINDFRSLMLE